MTLKEESYGSLEELEKGSFPYYTEWSKQLAKLFFLQKHPIDLTAQQQQQEVGE